MSFRDPKYVERGEDVVFDLKNHLVNPANNTHQPVTGYRFIVDSSSDVTTYDWYSVRISAKIIVRVAANAGALAAGDRQGIVNGTRTFLKKFNVLINGVQVCSNSEADLSTNVLNLVEYSKAFVDSMGRNSFFPSRHKSQRI